MHIVFNVTVRTIIEELWSFIEYLLQLQSQRADMACIVSLNFILFIFSFACHFFFLSCLSNVTYIILKKFRSKHIWSVRLQPPNRKITRVKCGQVSRLSICTSRITNGAKEKPMPCQFSLGVCNFSVAHS